MGIAIAAVLIMLFLYVIIMPMLPHRKYSATFERDASGRVITTTEIEETQDSRIITVRKIK